MPLCCPSFACGSATSSRGAGRFPGSGGFGRPWRVVRLALHSLSCPGLRAVVRRCSQGHTERQLLVTPVHPQPSLPSSLRSANGGLRAGVHHHKKVTQQWQRRFEERLEPKWLRMCGVCGVCCVCVLCVVCVCVFCVCVLSLMWCVSACCRVRITCLSQ